MSSRYNLARRLLLRIGATHSLAHLPAGACCIAPAMASSGVVASGLRPAVRNMSVRASNSVLDSTQAAIAVGQRQKLLQRCPIQLLHIRGVTFEDRQGLVSQLVPGQPVMFVKEPSNPFDPTAVKIETLDGKQLGHVSRFMTTAFPLQVCFGSVSSVGQVPGAGTWGALVACCPSLRGMSLDLLPGSWADRTNLQEVFGPTDWQQLQQLMLDRYKQHCAITSTHSSQLSLQVVPLWGFDYHKKQVWLSELVPICEPLAQAMQVLNRGSATAGTAGAADRQAALQLMMQVMQWPQQECEYYLAFVEQQRQAVEGDGWQLVQPSAADLAAEAERAAAAAAAWAAAAEKKKEQQSAGDGQEE